MENRPTGRIDRETGEVIWYHEGEAPPSASAAYTPADGPVKVPIPPSLIDRAQNAGVPVVSTARAGALRALRDAIRVAETPVPIGMAGRSPAARLARDQLGQEIQLERKRANLSRKGLHWRICNILDGAGISRSHGWGHAQIQQWEIGRSAPREVWPIIQALEVDEDTGTRWTRWWAEARKGVDPAEAPEAPPIEVDPGEIRVTGVPVEMADPDLDWQSALAEVEVPLLEKPEEELTAIERLQRTLEENADKLEPT